MSKDPAILYPTGEDAALAKELALKLEQANAEVSRAKEQRQEIVDQLVAMSGSHDGVGGEWGAFIYEEMPGRVRWRQLAQKVADGRLPGLDEDDIERHRGAPWREPRLYLNESETNE